MRSGKLVSQRVMCRALPLIEVGLGRQARDDGGWGVAVPAWLRGAARVMRPAEGVYPHCFHIHLWVHQPPTLALSANIKSNQRKLSLTLV